MSVSSIWECVCVCADLGDAVMLYVDDSRHGHLHTAKHSHHLQLLIIKWRSPKILHKQIQHEKRLFNGLYCTISHWYPTMNIFFILKVDCSVFYKHFSSSYFSVSFYIFYTCLHSSPLICATCRTDKFDCISKMMMKVNWWIDDWL